MAETYEEAAALLCAAEHPLFVTGAGISADSGLPTYRGIGGLYNDADTPEGMPIEMALSGRMLLSNPEVTWKYLWQIGSACQAATFNRGHEVIAEIERLKPDTWVLTQNIDGLHRAAGSKNLIEIHGRASQLYCLGCERAFTAEELIAGYAGGGLPPKCPSCEGLIRPNVVLFGETLPAEQLEPYYTKATVGRDLVVVIGTTGVFPYIAAPVFSARAQGVPTVEINPARTRLSDSVDHRIAESASPALDRLWTLMQRQ